jgi:hypothetical protein
MLQSLPTFLKKTIAENSPTDPDDVIITKRFLERLGNYEAPEWGLGDFTDDGLFKGIERFQEANGLDVDGVMKPGGETEQTLISKVAELSSSDSSESEEEQALNPSSKPSRAQCDKQFDQDNFICTGYYPEYGAKEVAICRSSASTRYAMCIRGMPTHVLPPLYNPRFNY